MTTQQLATFIPAAFFIACVPGANNLLSLQTGAQWGIKTAMQAVAGRCVAYALMVALVVAGLGQLLEASEFWFQCIKWLGALYLAWIGIAMLRSKPAQADSVATVQVANAWAHARKDFWVAMANPKAILLFSALLPQFVVQDSGLSYSSQMMVLGILYTIIESLTATGYAVVGRAAISAGKPSAQRLLMVQRVSGSMMIFMAGVLALSRRSSH